MKRFDLIVVGAGPAGLSAAVEAAKCNLRVIVFDENNQPGGQLFKQIHKFFGSKENKAKVRGYNIGKELLEEAARYQVQVKLESTVIGIYTEKEVLVMNGGQVKHYKGDTILIATGASENVAPFSGWTLPGVIGAGAAQTMLNLHGILPGKKVLMLGSGNVGLVVAFQLLQCGCDIVAMVDAAPKIGGYGVHASKLTRTGITFYLSHTIIRAEGKEHVERVVIGEVDKVFNLVPGTEQGMEVDTICMAVGLSPMLQLCQMAGCEVKIDKAKGGLIPVCNEYGETSIPGIYTAGDVSGIEEASSAMLEGRISGLAAAAHLGYLEKEIMEQKVLSLSGSLNNLRGGLFSPGNKGKNLLKTEEGIELSQSLLTKGYLDMQEVEKFPGVTSCSKIHPVIECTQNIPCNPCQDACPRNCISIGDCITALPIVKKNSDCTGCGMCVASCSGQAIFLIDTNYQDNYSAITIPYEFLPVPEQGEHGWALNRMGGKICEAEIIKVKSLKAFDKTTLLTMKVPLEWSSQARFYKRREISE